MQLDNDPDQPYSADIVASPGQTFDDTEKTKPYPVKKIVIQPLSSEEDILDAAESAQQEPQDQTTSPNDQANHITATDMYQMNEADVSTFVTEPLCKVAPSRATTVHLVTKPMPTRTKKASLLTLAAALLVGIAVAYVFFGQII